MIEIVSQNVEVFSLYEAPDVTAAVDAIMSGKITLLRVGSVFSVVYDPKAAGLTESVSILKERREGQLMSVVCSYEQAMRIADKKRVNEDFYRLSPHFCGEAIIRIPVNTSIPLTFPYNTEEGTMQFLSFEETHPLRGALMKGLSARGCEFISITSANIHGAPTIESTEAAKLLAAVFNAKASFLGMDGIKTVVADIPEDKGIHKGSFSILSFCDPEAIEVKRLVDKTASDFTAKHLEELFKQVDTQTPLRYAL